MEVTIRYNNNLQSFKNIDTITIGGNSADFIIPEFSNDDLLKLIYTDKYNNFIIINTSKKPEILLNGRVFSKILVNSDFEITSPKLNSAIKISIVTDNKFHKKQEESNLQSNTEHSENIVTKIVQESNMITTNNNMFDCDTEKNRISIIKEIGYKVSEFKNSIRTASIINLILTTASVILSVISSFAITNYLLGLKIDNSTATINLTTNFWFLAGTALIILAICITLKYAISSLVSFNSTARQFGRTDIMQKLITAFCIIVLFVIYVLNLAYYKSISGFASFFTALLFVGGLGIVTVGSGYFHAQIKVLKQHLNAYEYREDFEAVIKNYRGLISAYINKLSPNKINTVKNNLLNNQLKMVLEVMIGLLTAPFLAYGVSNTLAGCFPEAANWVRISGIRFSPIFLILATFLIIFAFFSFVRGFTISKQIKGSEIIKYDGFHDYNTHGVNILGLDSMKNLEKEKSFVIFVACFIILIEFTMNVSYFITEIGADIQGMFLSFVTALVPTALLIAETHILSATMYKIHNLSDLLENLD